MKNPALTLQVRKDMKTPSSMEDDIGKFSLQAPVSLPE
jgi:hypothetical protein